MAEHHFVQSRIAYPTLIDHFEGAGADVTQIRARLPGVQ